MTHVPCTIGTYKFITADRTRNARLSVEIDYLKVSDKDGEVPGAVAVDKAAAACVHHGMGAARVHTGGAHALPEVEN